MQSACAVLSAVDYPSVPYFSISISKNGAIFRGGELLAMKYVFWFYLQLSSETFLFLRRNEFDMIINVRTSSCKVQLFLLDFNET